MKGAEAKLWFMLLAGFVVIAFALFLSAGTTNYWQAWDYLGVGFVTSVFVTLYIIRDPILLESRTKGGPTVERRPVQKMVASVLGLSFIAMFIVPALDRRFGWSHMPSWLSIAGDLLIVVSMWSVSRVFKENSFGSAAIEISKEQKVISTGPYAIVRNPMYSCAIAYFIGISLALGSYWGLVPCILGTCGLIWRLFDEEKMLAQNLPGYKEYCKKVRWHLIPGIF
jgi:protein-S-isoprenylcysteine O-methyltransferase Ste14